MKTYIYVFAFLMLFIGNAKAQEIKGNYAIKNVQTGLLLRIKDANSKDGTPIVLYEPENWKCMTWNFKHVDGDTYQLQNLFSGKTMQPITQSSPEITLNEQPLVDSKSVQQYDFIAISNGVYLIKLKNTEQYLTASNSGEVNSLVKLAAKKGDKSQQWTIYQQSPTM